MVTSAADGQIVARHPAAGPDQVVAGPSFVTQRGLAVGDRITLELAGWRVTARIARKWIDAPWAILPVLAPGTPVSDFTVTLARAPTPRHTPGPRPPSPASRSRCAGPGTPPPRPS
ncbi:hypothetical protein GCM10010172_29320 [Paractinoplanes ferrugineus]|uniref:Uncharacterized protein n=1 Tax=Paractinoplanes ferrugineus TaxID=113564 RepID=A0A919J9U7_9ACTN|nr:hypothetical protein [Actinoplanes ferrugineus]GIE15703.1 hypothetical protein Afe05nite_75430 [Actinoplanes ferrugineus]